MRPSQAKASIDPKKSGISQSKGGVGTHLGLNIQRDESISDQVMNGLKPLLSNKVLPIMIETKVSCLIPKPQENRAGTQRY